MKTNVLWFVKPENYCAGCGYAITPAKPREDMPHYTEAISYTDGHGHYHMGCSRGVPRYGTRASWLVNDIMKRKNEKQKA